MLDGYGAIIDGLVTFVASPAYTADQKHLLMNTALAAGKGEISTQEAKRILDADNKDSGRIFREWVNAGSAFTMMLATVGIFLLTYLDCGGNAPLEALATEKVDEFLGVEEDRMLPSVAVSRSIRPQSRPAALNNVFEGEQRSTAGPKSPNENRKARRARIKKSKTKSSK